MVEALPGTERGDMKVLWPVALEIGGLLVGDSECATRVVHAGVCKPYIHSPFIERVVYLGNYDLENSIGCVKEPE